MTASPRFTSRRRAALGLACGLLAAGAFALARLDATMVESLYCAGIFPPLAAAISGASRLLPFSLAELSIAFAAIAASALLVRGLFRALRGQRGWRAVAGAGAANLLLAAGAGLLFFELAWGLNHARRPLAAHLEIVAPSPSTAALAEAAQLLAARAVRTRAELGELGPAACELRPLRRGSTARLDEAWARAAAAVPALAGPAPLVRFPWSSRLLTLAGLTGVYSPFTGEAHVNGELPIVLLPFVACHEIAHQRGFAREDEANFLGWFVTSLSSDAAFRYSGELVALDLLSRADLGARATLMKSLDLLVRADLAEVNAFWRREGRSSAARRITRVITTTNDLYLKGQGQASGVASYGRMVDLLVAELLRSEGTAARGAGVPPIGGRAGR